MVNKNKINNSRPKKIKRPGDIAVVVPDGKPARGKLAYVKSKEFSKKERAKIIQERQTLRAQKQKEIEEERTKAKQIKEEKIRQYKKKRLERTKAISKRTQRGQPLMKDRMQLLLKQIQEMKKNG